MREFWVDAATLVLTVLRARVNSATSAALSRVTGLETRTAVGEPFGLEDPVQIPPGGRGPVDQDAEGVDSDPVRRAPWAESSWL